MENKTVLCERWWEAILDVNIFGRIGCHSLAFATNPRGFKNSTVLPSGLKVEHLDNSSLLSMIFAQILQTRNYSNPE